MSAWLSIPRGSSVAIAAKSVASKSANFDVDIVAADFNLIRRNPDGRIHERLARRDVVLPAMPRASYRPAAQFAFRQRSPTMQADVIDRVKRAVHVGQRDDFAVEL